MACKEICACIYWCKRKSEAGEERERATQKINNLKEGGKKREKYFMVNNFCYCLKFSGFNHRNAYVSFFSKKKTEKNTPSHLFRLSSAVSHEKNFFFTLVRFLASKGHK